MIGPLLVPIVAASLLGSAHCAGMCGPLVAFYAGNDGSKPSTRLLAHLAYHGGRLVTYSTLGGIAGMLGAAVDLAGKAAGVGKAAALVAGTAMVLWALALLAEQLGFSIMRRAPAPLSNAIARIVARVGRHPPALRALVLGLASALLPCGWLYAFAVVAAGTGSVLGGALTMLAFWTGTVPLLFGIGIGVGTLGARLRRHVPVASALVLLAIGLYAVLGRSNLPALAAQNVERVIAGEAEPSCCHHESERTAP